MTSAASARNTKNQFIKDWKISTDLLLSQGSSKLDILEQSFNRFEPSRLRHAASGGLVILTECPLLFCSLCLQLPVPQLKLFRGHFLVKYAAAGCVVMEMENHDGHDGSLSTAVETSERRAVPRLLTEGDIEQIRENRFPPFLSLRSVGGDKE